MYNIYIIYIYIHIYIYIYIYIYSSLATLEDIIIEVKILITTESFTLS